MQKSLLLGTMLATAAWAAPVSAQESVAVGKSAASGDAKDAVPPSGDIVVTAQRVEQRLQDVPVSVTAITGDVLQTRQVDSFDQLQYIAPSVSFNAGINARQSATTIRGIGTGLFNPGIESSVAIVIDGVVLGREGAGIFDLSDVERIEVLRGPQGTLFGKNSSAGVVSVITKRPTDTLTAEASVAYGSYNELNLFGAVSGPLDENVKARLSGYRNTRDGYIDNVLASASQRKLNDRDEYGFRAKIEADLGDLNLLLSGDFANRKVEGNALTIRKLSPGGAGTGLLATGFPLLAQQTTALGIVPGPENRAVAPGDRYFIDAKAGGVSAEATLRFGDLNLVSLSSYRKWTQRENNDADNLPLPLLKVNSGFIRLDQYSQELRLVSASNKPLSFTLGLYYFHQKIFQNQVQLGTAGLDLLRSLPPGVLLGTDLNTDFRESNYAVFGQGQYKMTDALALIAGFRVLRSELSGAIDRRVAAGAVAPFAGQNAPGRILNADFTDSALVWRLGLQYYVNSDVNVFATASRGYKSGGIVSELTVDPTVRGGSTLPVVRPEIPMQYEVGIRSQLFDRMLTANFTAFRTTIKDFQTQALIPQPGGTTAFSVANAGRVKTYGVEADLSLRPSPGLTLSTAFAYTNAKVDEFPNAPCFALQTTAQGCTAVPSGGSVQNLAGKRLANAPEWTVNGLVRYEFAVSEALGAFAQAGLQYRSSATSDITNDPNKLLASRTLIDAQLGVTFRGGRGTATIFGRNLTNQNFVESIVNTPFDTGGYSQFLTLEARRTFGAKLALKY